MTISVRRKSTRGCAVRCLLSCCVLGCSLLIATSITYSRLMICLPSNINNQTTDRQDDWKYQNSVTGQWYHWRIPYTNYHNTTPWTIKWLNTSPSSSLGVIVYLTTRYEVGLLNQSLFQLSRLLVNNPRPVVIFHEGDFDNNDTQQSLASTLGSRTPLGFERIKFVNTPYQQQRFRHRIQVGYLNMCRFFTLMLPNHPLLTLFSFYWRLDAHSYIFAPNPIPDPFEIMRERQAQYGFVLTSIEGESYAVGLWSFFHNFLNQYCLKPSRAFHQTQTGWFGGYSLAIVFTNFAIANTSLFRDHQMIRTWLQAADRSGGIYRHRWGDAPLHTLAVTQFLRRDEIVRFRYFGYMHRGDHACASGTSSKQCTEQLQPFLGKPGTHYERYDDGCWPSSSNPLCHYYPEIKPDISSFFFCSTFE